MPRRTTALSVDANGREVDTALTYECICGFVMVRDRREVGASTGARRRGDDPAVQASPQYFVRIGDDRPMPPWIRDLPIDQDGAA